MNDRVIEELIQIANEQESNAHGSNKSCFLIGEYALLEGNFSIEETEKMIQLEEELEKKGVRVARTLGYKAINPNTQDQNSDRTEGYVLQQRAEGEPLLDRTNWSDEPGRYQIEYLKQIDAISHESQEFFNEYVRGWIEIQKAGLQVDPSKNGNFIYEQGRGITFIDLGMTSRKADTKTTILEQIAVITNLSAYYKCYPEIQQAVQKRIGIIIEKYKNAVREQGIDTSLVNQVIEERSIPQVEEVQSEHTEETPEQEMERLEIVIDEHIKAEEEEKLIRLEEQRRLQAEKEEKEKIRREKRQEEEKRLREQEKLNSNKRNEAEMYVLLQCLMDKGVIPEEQASIYKDVFTRKRNIYLDLNPELFRRESMVVDLKSVIPNVEDNDIRIYMQNRELVSNNEISSQTYDQIETTVKDFFRQYFEETSQNIEVKLAEYSEMKKAKEEGQLTEEQIIDYALLEAELVEFSKAKELFPVLEVGEQAAENADRVANYLQNMNRSEESISPLQIEEATVKVGTGITDINKATQDVRAEVTKEEINEREGSDNESRG